ncbi:hypothetical protein EVA_08465 [gut metagenome]|uniref:Uncharacterized protein n=1 Tax=gut metagenome TaxID=749906 RepID=J9GT09_9ZZZZ
MVVSGFLRSSKTLRSCRKARSRVRTSLKQTATTISNAAIQHSVTSFLVTWLLVLLRNAATRAMA